MSHFTPPKQKIKEKITNEKLKTNKTIVQPGRFNGTTHRPVPAMVPTLLESASAKPTTQVCSHHSACSRKTTEAGQKRCPNDQNKA